MNKDIKVGIIVIFNSSKQIVSEKAFVSIFNRKEFPEALPRGFPLKMSTPNLFRGLNIKFRILIPKGQNETSKIPLWLCLGDSSFQEIFYF